MSRKQTIRVFFFILLLCILTIGLQDYTFAKPEDTYDMNLESTSDEGFPPFFRPYGIYPATSIWGSIGIGDFNNDGLLDVVESNSDFYVDDYQINVFLQNSSGFLNSPIAYNTGIRPESLATGDINNDFRDDIVVANFGENTISVFLQLENETMSSQVKYDAAEGPDGIEVADLNNDGLNDVVVSHWNSSQLGVYLQQSDGTLDNMISYWSPIGGYDDIGVGDLNNDGLTDVVKMNGQGETTQDISIYLQNEAGNLDNPKIYDLPGSDMGNGISVGDVTGDGLSDVVMSYGGNIPRAYIAIFAQTDGGTLILDATYEAYEIPGSVAISDVNMDGKSDVIVTHAQWLKLSIYLQNSAGDLGSYDLYPLPYYRNHRSRVIDIDDINNDGLPDIAFAHYTGPAILYHYPIFTDQVFLPFANSN